MWLRNTSTGLLWEVTGAHAEELSANPAYERVQAPDGSVFREGSGEDDIPLRPSGEVSTDTLTTQSAPQTETETPTRDSHQATSPTDSPNPATGKPSPRTRASRRKDNA